MQNLAGLHGPQAHLLAAVCRHGSFSFIPLRGIHSVLPCLSNKGEKAARPAVVALLCADLGCRWPERERCHWSEARDKEPLGETRYVSFSHVYW